MMNLKLKMILGDKHLYHQRGSSTIEATLILPAIFFTIILFLFVSLVVYQKVVAYYTSAQAADKIAFTWDNSHKDVGEGHFPFHEHDHLYWRLTDDRLIGYILNRNSSSQASVSSTDAQSTNLAEQKLLRITTLYPDSLTGSFDYHNRLLERKVQVRTQNPINSPSIIQEWFGNTLLATSESRVVDPVEFIRTIDLIRQYKDRLQERDKVNQVLDRQKAKKK